MKNSFTLIEVLFAIFILTMGISAAFSLIHNTLAYAKISSSRLTAAYLAQEGIEVARNIRDGNWLEQRTTSTIQWDDGLTGTCMIPRISPCDFYGDGNFDGVITEDDVTCDLWDACYGKAAAGLCVRYDLNGSGYIDISDFSIIAGYLTDCLKTFSVCDTKAQFQRKITITKPADNVLNVLSEVSFRERGGTHQVAAQEKIYQWR